LSPLTDSLPPAAPQSQSRSHDHDDPRCDAAPPCRPALFDAACRRRRPPVAPPKAPLHRYAGALRV